MFEKLRLFTLIQCVLHIVLSDATADFGVKCPSEQLRYIRANSICRYVENYTCLQNSVDNAYKENCKGPKTVPPGEKTVINNGYFNTEPCSFTRFQPFSFSTSQGNDCVYAKSMCNDEGQIVYYDGNGRYDRKCRCDYRKHFSFMSTERIDKCSCSPTTEDCSCYIKLCSKGQILSPDYECITLEDSYGKSTCKDIASTLNEPTDNTYDQNKETKEDERTQKGSDKWIATPLSTFLSVITIVGIVCILLVPMVARKIAFSFDYNKKTEIDEYVLILSDADGVLILTEADYQSYKQVPFTCQLLDELKSRGLIQTCKTKESIIGQTGYKADTMDRYTEQNLNSRIQKGRSNTLILRRSVEKKFADVREELINWQKGCQNGKPWIGFNDVKKHV